MGCAALTVVVVRHVAECEDIELPLSTPAGDVDGKEDWPCYDAANQADNHGDFEEAQEEVTIERVVVQDPGVWDGVLPAMSVVGQYNMSRGQTYKLSYPSEERTGYGRRPLVRPQ